MADRPDISIITLDSGSSYNVKDAKAREMIAALSGYTKYLGVTSSNISDGSTTNPVVINSENVTADTGSIVTHNSAEFIWNGSAWQEFGDLSGLGALAYKDSAETDYTPAGSVSQPTFTGSELTSSGSFTPEGTVEIDSYTPAGSVSQPTFTGNAMNSSGSYTPEGSVTISKGTGTANYTPEGTVSQPTFTGSAMESSGSFTPEGSVSTPTITVTPNTDTVNSIENVGTLPSLSMTVVNENLTISFSQGTLPTKGANKTVVTGIASASSSKPTFTGTSGTVEVSGTPQGTVSQPTFSGTGAELTATFSGTQKAVSVSGTPSGTVSQPTFTGTAAELEADFTGTSGNVSVKGTPAGTVSQPTFSGTQATIEVS